MLMTVRAARCCAAAHGEFLLSDVVTAPGRKLTLPLRDKRGYQLPGCVASLTAEELPNNNAAVNLPNMTSQLLQSLR
jgi:hypothetical protein